MVTLTRWHHKDLEAAKERARFYRGCVIYSAPPKSDLLAPLDRWGYWSEPDVDVLLRGREKIVFRSDE